MEVGIGIVMILLFYYYSWISYKITVSKGGLTPPLKT